MPQPTRSKVWPLAIMGVLALVVAVLWTTVDNGPTEQDDETRTALNPPPAVAPPDTGVLPPELRVIDARAPRPASAPRPQQQLAVWSASMSDELNIPKAALEAYGYADRASRLSNPDCGMSWSVLAGIGAVESSHGRFGGAKLDRTGRPSLPIRGLPLNGVNGVKRVPDTDTGKLDGDRTFDRAVGPLQFIPATWREWGRDADADGMADPNDIDDAALAAANYLCEVGGDLRRPNQFWTALLHYNESRAYGQDVLDRADHYGRVSRTLDVKR